MEKSEKSLLIAFAVFSLAAVIFVGKMLDATVLRSIVTAVLIVGALLTLTIVHIGNITTLSPAVKKAVLILGSIIIALLLLVNLDS